MTAFELLLFSTDPETVLIPETVLASSRICTCASFAAWKEPVSASFAPLKTLPMFTPMAIAAVCFAKARSRPWRVSPIPRITLMASMAWSDPMMPGSTPSTPASEQLGASSAGGGSGRRHR